VAWYRRDGTPGAPEVFVGSGPAMVLNQTHPYMLRVQVTDSFGRTADSHLAVFGALVSGEPGRERFALTVASVTRASIDALVESPAPGACRLELFDVAGRQVARLWQGELAERRLLVRWDATGLPSGLYFLSFSWADRRIVRRVAFAR
jgi:hypothetical protein